MECRLLETINFNSASLDTEFKSQIKNLLNDLDNDVEPKDSLITIKEKLDNILEKNPFKYYFQDNSLAREKVREAITNKIIDSLKSETIRKFIISMRNDSPTLYPGEYANMSVIEFNKLLNIILQIGEYLDTKLKSQTSIDINEIEKLLDSECEKLVQILISKYDTLEKNSSSIIRQTKLCLALFINSESEENQATSSGNPAESSSKKNQKSKIPLQATEYEQKQYQFTPQAPGGISPRDLTTIPEITDFSDDEDSLTENISINFEALQQRLLKLKKEYDEACLILLPNENPNSIFIKKGFSFMAEKFPEILLKAEVCNKSNQKEIQQFCDCVQEILNTYKQLIVQNFDMPQDTVVASSVNTAGVDNIDSLSLQNRLDTGYNRIRGALMNEQPISDLQIDVILGKYPPNESTHNTIIQEIVQKKDKFLAKKIIHTMAKNPALYVKIQENRSSDESFSKDFRNMLQMIKPETSYQKIVSQEPLGTEQKKLAITFYGVAIVLAGCATASALTGVGLPGAIVFGIAALACVAIGSCFQVSAKKINSLPKPEFVRVLSLDGNLAALTTHSKNSSQNNTPAL